MTRPVTRPEVVAADCGGHGGWVRIPAAHLHTTIDVLDGRLEYQFTCPRCGADNTGIIRPEMEATMLTTGCTVTVRDLP